MKLSSDKKIFIAGANGMVGSAVKRLLSKKGFGSKNNKRVIFTPSRSQLNLSNYNEVKDWFELNKPSIVIIAAAKVGGILANSSNPYEFLLENMKIQNNIIESSWKVGVEKLIFLGSSCIYPKFAQQPIKEEYLMSGELEPTNEWYAIAKISGIKLCEALNKQYNFDAISLMPSNLYGEGDNYDLFSSHVLPAFINRFHEAKEKNLKNVTCWGTGKALREFLNVDDLAEAILFCLENWSLNNNNAPKDPKNKKLAWLNVGSGEEITIKELAEKIAKIIGYQGEINWDISKPDGTPRKLMDSSRIRSLGWRPLISLDEGLKKTIKIYENNQNK